MLDTKIIKHLWQKTHDSDKRGFITETAAYIQNDIKPLNSSLMRKFLAIGKGLQMDFDTKYGTKETGNSKSL